MSDLHLENPLWANGVWVVIALTAILFVLERRGSTLLDRLLSPLMQGRLVARPSATRRYLRVGLLGLALLCLVVALVRPQWGLRYEATPRAGTELMVCLDVSKSMLSEDTVPNRLERAKAEISDLLSYLKGDHVGLVVFAGQAAVSCPMTPDFGFLRIVLEDASPFSVTRGGTNLAAPIQKAVEGFGSTGDVSRAIILITDGEDHDSFVLEAAEKAAERGIKVFPIGFGSEDGSEIVYTDRYTGARTTVKDADGNVVRSRLDGELLAQIADTTGGLYLPVGTGSLDLDSVYNDVIAPLTRGQLDGRGRPVRNDLFQWAILAGLLSLLAAVAVASNRPRVSLGQRTGTSSALATASALLGLSVWLTMTLWFAPVALAQNAEPSQTPATPTTQPDEAGEAAPTVPLDPIPEDPRLAYNSGRTRLESGALDSAERFLASARKAAGTDGVVRYRATYNLGWVHVRRHDELLEENPEAALESLHEAADWFRDAVRLRPEESAARHNLEVVMKKALALADSLRKKDDRTFETRLDELIERQRELCGQVRSLVEREQAAGASANKEAFRDEYRGEAVTERKILSDAGPLADDMVLEQEAIEAKADEEATPEDKVRAAQLGAALHYLHRARERLGQTRRQLRQQRGERSNRRAAASLRELKRARDQFRNPVEVLGAITQAAAETMKHTQTTVQGSGLGIDTSERPQVPAWLTMAFLQESQDDVNQRTEELTLRLEAALDQQDQMTGAEAPELSAEQQKFLDQVQTAVPFLRLGLDAFAEARATLETAADESALDSQQTGILRLLEAREQFLDLKGLIELTYGAERQSQQILALEDSSQIAEYLGMLIETQEKNATRATRMRAMVDEGEQALSTEAGTPQQPNAQPPHAGPSPEQTDPEQAEAERQRFQMARQLLDRLDEDLASGQSALAAKDLAVGRTEVDQAVNQLEHLRRLFFSIIEHLQDTARRQSELNDETAEVATVAAAEDLPREVGPLVPRQKELIPISEEIARVLGEQAQQMAQGAPGGAGQPSPEQQQETQEKLARAAELVGAAREEMVEAASGLEGVETQTEATPAAPDEPGPLDETQEHQRTAFKHLVEALHLLQPPQDQEQQQQQQDQQNQEQQQQQQQADEQEQEKTDPAQALQEVRDREAKRRQEKNEKTGRRPDPTIKDW